LLSLAKLMMKKANFLVLDEPTNHLDLTSKELLESALIDYPGTIFFVSHDRYFINKIADKVFELTQDGMTVYLGDYDYYVEKRQENMEREKFEREQNPAITDKTDEASDNLSDEEQKKKQREARKIEREIEAIEAKIETLEEEIEALEKQLDTPDIQTDYEKMYELTSSIENKNEAMEILLEEWEALH